MLIWIFLVLILYLVGLFLPSLFLIPKVGLLNYVGARDADPEPSAMHARLQRAHRNFLETLPVFLGLAILTFVIPEADVSMAIMGAQVFFFARLAYLPMYLFAVPWLRSLAWTVGFVGLAMMAFAL